MNKSWNSRTEKGREEIDNAVMDKINDGAKDGTTIRALCSELQMKDAHVRVSVARLEAAEKIERSPSRYRRALLYKPKA